MSEEVSDVEHNFETVREHNFETVREQITKTPVHKSVRDSDQESVKKEKDPKKVAAGKKLAEYNKRAKEALKEKMKREAEKEEERETGESAIAEQGSRMGGVDS